MSGAEAAQPADPDHISILIDRIEDRNVREALTFLADRTAEAIVASAGGLASLDGEFVDLIRHVNALRRMP